MKYICQYCGKEFTNPGGWKMHENNCKLNPNREQNLKKRKIRSDNLSHDKWLDIIKEKHPDLLNHIEILGNFIHSTQSSIQIKCKHCGEIYNESLNNIVRIGSWKCKNHCSYLIRRQKELNDRKENLIKTINEKNPEFLNRFEIIGDWDGQLRSKIKVKCKKCGLIKKFMYNVILTTSTYSCKGCAILNKLEFNKLTLSKKEVINWCKQYKPKLLERLEIIEETLNLENNKIKCKCLKCNNIIEISIDAFFRKDTKDIFCPNCQKRINKECKLNFLTKYDLLSMSWSVILDLIGEDKLPKEFNKLVKFGENTPERKKMIQNLIDSYNIEITENDEIVDNKLEDENDINIETIVNNINDEENIYDDINNEDELKPYKEIKTTGDILQSELDKLNDEEINEIFSTGDKWIHIMSKEIGKLWNNVLRDDENHNENTINEIHQKLKNNSLTKFEKYVYEEFIKEYNEVINLEIH